MGGWVRLAGAALLVAAGAIHLDLYLTGYRTIPVIGWLFLLQVVAAFGLGALVALSRTWLASAAGALFALGTLGGYVLSIWIGLFGFREVRTSAGVAAGVVEVAAFGLLGLASLGAQRPSGGPSAIAGARSLVVVGLGTAAAAVVLAVAAVTAGAAGSAAGSAAGGRGAGAGLRAATVGGVRILTNSRGFTLYWFALDTPRSSACAGSCAAYWPPVPGPATLGPGVPGRLGAIRRPGGSPQATYDGHPLYTYVGDSSPGQARGNGLNLNGGLWHEMTVSG